MSQVSDALNTLWTNLEDDELKIVLPIGDNYFQNVINNPDPANVVTQSVALETSVVAALPNIEAAAARDVATSLKTLMDTQVASLNNAVPAAAPAAPAPTPPAAA